MIHNTEQKIVYTKSSYGMAGCLSIQDHFFANECEGHAMNTSRSDPVDFRGSMPRSTRELSNWIAREPKAGVLEPELPVVDAHHHLFGAVDDRHF